MTWIHWALLSAFFAGLTAVLAKAGTDKVAADLATAIRTTVVLAFVWAAAFLTARPFEFSTLPRRTWWLLCASGLATGLSWLCYFRALKLGEASRVVPVDKLGVVFAILLAALLLREKLTVQHLVGGMLITIGAVVIAWKR